MATPIRITVTMDDGTPARPDADPDMNWWWRAAGALFVVGIAVLAFRVGAWP